MLLATTAAEVQQLEARAVMLQQQGIPGVLLLSPRELKMHEPALQLPTGSIGLLVSSDAQIVRGWVYDILSKLCCAVLWCMSSANARLTVMSASYCSSCDLISEPWTPPHLQISTLCQMFMLQLMPSCMLSFSHARLLLFAEWQAHSICHARGLPTTCRLQ